MRKLSVARAKSQLASLVDAAERQNERTLILKRGKAVAAIVPAGLALRVRRRRSSGVRKRLSAAEILELFRNLDGGDARHSAVTDLLRGRR